MVPFEIRFWFDGKTHTGSVTKTFVNDHPMYTVRLSKELSNEDLQIDTDVVNKRFHALTFDPKNLVDAIGFELLGKEIVDRN